MLLLLLLFSLMLLLSVPAMRRLLLLLRCTLLNAAPGLSYSRGGDNVSGRRATSTHARHNAKVTTSTHPPCQWRP